MNYLIAQRRFLDAIGNPTGDERLRAVRAFDATFVAQYARLLDGCAQFWEDVKWW